MSNPTQEVLPAQTTIAWAGVTGTPTTIAGYGITDAQPLDSDLTSIAALGSAADKGLYTTAAHTWAEFSLPLAARAAFATLANSNTGDQTNISGKAATADKLTSPVTINGVSFDGSANITVTAAAGTLTGATLNATVTDSSLTSVGVISSGTWSATIIALKKGGTGADLNATGGASQVLMQTSVGGAITVAQLAASNLSNGTSGSGLVVLATSPSLTTPALGTPSAGVLSNCTGYPNPEGWTVIVATVDQDVTNNPGAVLADHAEFQFAVTATKSYLVEFDLVISGNNTTGDYAFNFALANGAALLQGDGNAQLLNAANAIANNSLTTAGAYNPTLSANIPVGVRADLTYPVAVRGVFAFTVDTTTTFKFQFGNNTAAAGRTSRTWKGSVLRYKQLN